VTSSSTARSEQRTIRRGVLKDAAIFLLSPIWLIVGVFILGNPVVLGLGWVAGAMVLWLSRGWTAGQKLIGTVLSAASLFGIGTMSFTVNPRSTTDALLALLVFVLLVLLYMTPAATSAVYLLRRVHPSFGRRGGGEHRAAAGLIRPWRAARRSGPR
jgi:hypothetical protein